MNDILAQIAEAKEELFIANANFNHAIEQDVIDYWIYRIKSAQTKYGSLIKQMRTESALKSSDNKEKTA